MGAKTRFYVRDECRGVVRVLRGVGCGLELSFSV